MIGSRESHWWGENPFERCGMNPFDKNSMGRQSDSAGEDLNEDGGDEFIVHSESGSPVVLPSSCNSF